ncbi:TrkA C-terminal domain-containing protein [Mariprofundus ferrooxydans]|uniref:TrkA C-terminal domain-containing protein n=1 Tax=Mariprofundus ferrooxydans TaxID=314344 RepID=UPI00037F8653|nr:TrkA C-terminal domain-containing protein [Mariprofundus ferrooxydans]
MEGLYFLIPTLMAVLLSMLFVRAGAIALVRTGMHYEQAKFQALSAFTATGFTTHEAEKVVNHPTRRKIISMLMIGGYAGIAAVTVSGTSSFVTSTAQNLPRNLLILCFGLICIYALARHIGLMQRWENMVERLLYRSSLFEFEPVEELLHLIEGFGLVKIEVTGESPLVGKSIIQIGTEHRDALILGVERGRTWMHARRMDEPLQENDQLIVYGHLERLKEAFGEHDEV